MVPCSFLISSNYLCRLEVGRGTGILPADKVVTHLTNTVLYFGALDMFR